MIQKQYKSSLKEHHSVSILWFVFLKCCQLVCENFHMISWTENGICREKKIKKNAVYKYIMVFKKKKKIQSLGEIILWKTQEIKYQFTANSLCCKLPPKRK